MNSILFSIETNETYYTGEEDDAQYIPALVERIEAEATAWMAENYPDVDFETRFVEESLSFNNKSKVWGDEQEMEEILEGLESFVGNNLGDWWPEEAGQNG